MAKNDKETVTRIRSGDSIERKKSKAAPTKVEAKKEKRVKVEKERRSYGILGSFLGYFKGAWFELRQVRWPTRGATWSLTGAVLLFTAFFVVLILLLDALFKYMFEIILR